MRLRFQHYDNKYTNADKWSAVPSSEILQPGKMALKRSTYQFLSNKIAPFVLG